ncbi:dnaJ homolog subfamily C member 17 [Schistocerca piceifrons]|uniref:dnaJ homolog subfamily C member 17 n=1 Tax=Schistocerca piceifrons TaxID=274613 RepID=UPI001F5FA3B0|nr:dnaJ homolog subfamily C member 17 [Schistocerca piceifrons]
MGEKKLPEENLYELLGINIEATTQEVKKAYRKTALKCHPDKNPDNPKAAELFHKLSNALEILTDESARAAYDKVLKAKQAAKLRTQQLDSRRKKFKEELEARERAAQEAAAKKSEFLIDTRTDEEKLQAEIDRLRKEGSKAVEEEIRYVQKIIEEEREQRANRREQEANNQYRLRIRWNVNKSDVNNGGYSYDMLHKLLSKYGNVVALILSPKKKGRALVEFESKDAAIMAQKYEKGLTSNPLIVEWLTQPHNEEDVTTVPSSQFSSTESSERHGLFPSMNTGGAMSSGSYARSSPSPMSHMKVTGSDFESLVLRKMKQAEERKKLAEKMQKEELDNEDV